jgi:ribokinase
MAATVTVIGDALLDVHVVPSERPRLGEDVPAEVRLEPGGQGANVAVRLARQGCAVRLSCALGTDAAGALIRERLAADGIGLNDLGSSATGVVVVLLDAARERTMYSQRVPFAGRVASTPPPPNGWLVVSGYVLLEPDASISAGEAPHRVLLGCALDQSEATTWLDHARSLAPHLVILNADEARVLARRDGQPAALARAVADELGSIAVVTHQAGAAAALDGQELEVTSTDAAPVVDATGAGDAFAAGLIAGLVDGAWPPSRDRLEQALVSSVSLAAAVARVPGAQTRVNGEPA